MREIRHTQNMMCKFSVVCLLLIVSFVGANGNESDEKPDAQEHDQVQEHDKILLGEPTVVGRGTSTSPLDMPLPQHQTILLPEPALKPKKEFEVAEDSEESKHLKTKIEDDTGKKEKEGTEHWQVSMKCMNCLCYFATDCALGRPCLAPNFGKGLETGMEKGDCGPFHISFPFWADANKEDMKLDDPVMEAKWKSCSLDLECATESIQKYLAKYPHDCNGDGKVDCVDYAAIHTLGPFGCKDKKKLDNWNKDRRKELLKCMGNNEHEHGKSLYLDRMRELQEKYKLQDIAGRLKSDVEHKETPPAIEEKGKHEETVHTKQSADDSAQNHNQDGIGLQ